jgi:hypothetical protein
VPSAPVETVVEYEFGPEMEKLAPAKGAPPVTVFEIKMAPTRLCGSVKGNGALGVPVVHVAAWSTTTLTACVLSSAYVEGGVVSSTR